jgi:hypothetical protein
VDAAGVDRAVIHPVMWDPDSNELAVEAARAHPILRHHGLVLLIRQTSAAIDLKKPARDEGAAILLSDPRSQSWPDDETLDWLFRGRTAEHSVSLQASAFLPRVCEIAGVIPD